jgi:hypothetical protein
MCMHIQRGHRVDVSPILRGLVDVRQHEVQTFWIIYVQREEPDQAEIVDE